MDGPGLVPPSDSDARRRALEVLSPLGEPTAAPRRLAPRPHSLVGRRLGIVDNGKPNAAALLREVERRLIALGVSHRALWRDKIATYPLPQHHVAELAQSCDVAVVGVGD